MDGSTILNLQKRRSSDPTTLSVGGTIERNACLVQVYVIVAKNQNTVHMFAQGLKVKE